MGTAGLGRSIRAASARRARPYPHDSANPRSRASRVTSMDSQRQGVTNFVHIGLVVEDLDDTVRFLALLGFDCGEPGCSTASGSIGSSVLRT